jgi:hypothetical protein
MKYAFLFLIVAYSLSAFAKRPSLAELHQCAEGVSDGRFGNFADSLIRWSENPFEENESSSVAVSLFLEGSEPKFLTVTPKNILLTQAYKNERRSDSGPGNLTFVQVTLNLGQNNSPWINEIKFYLRHEVHPMPMDSDTILTRPYSEINSHDILKDAAADQATDRLIEVLRDRIRAAPNEVAAIYESRQNEPDTIGNFQIGGGPGIIRTRPEDRYLNEYDLKRLKEGLCSCESIYPEVEEVRKQMTNPDYSVWVWPADQEKSHKMNYADLICGES